MNLLFLVLHLTVVLSSSYPTTPCANPPDVVRICTPENFEQYRRLGYDPDHCNSSHFLPACLPGYGAPWTNSTDDLGETLPTHVCCAGYFCLQNFVCQAPCEFGAYCPRGVPTGSASCKPYGTARSTGLDHSCGGSPNPVSPCPSGYYCPDPLTKKVCPAGSFCRGGSVSPEPCPWLTYCPKETSSPSTNAAGFTFVAVLAAVLGTLSGVEEQLMRRRVRRQAQAERADREARIRAGVAASVPRLPRLSARSSRSDEWARRSAASPPPPTDEGQPLLTTLESATGSVAVGRGAVSFTNFSLRLPGTDQYILRHATGRFSSGKLTAILGGSGCGKTSLVSYVAGHSSAIPDGQLYVNASVVGYVPQEAVLLEQLTVYENLIFSASLRRPAWESSAERRQVVDEVIRAVDLNKVRHGRVGSAKSRGLSGGQKSRLSFAFEAVASPTLILADEITSGVDSTTAMDLLRNLRMAAEDGAAVAAILHQPRYECIALFDMLLVLSREGRTAYFGKASEALDHFLSLGFVLPQFTNPYDLIIDAVQGECFPANDDWRAFLPHLARGVQWHPNLLADIFEEVLEPNVREENAAFVEQEQAVSESPLASRVADDFLHESVGIARQFALVLWASWLEMLRTVRTLVSDAVLLCVSGLIVGVLFPFDVKVFQILEVGFLLSVVLGSSAALGAVRVFGTGRLMYERTSASGLSTLAYFLAKVALQLVQVIILPSAFLAMFYSISAPRGLLIDYMSIAIATYWAASGLGIWTGAMIAPERAQLASVVFVLISIFFAGFEPKLPDFRKNPTTWVFLGPITSLSFARWTVASIFSAETGRFPPVFRFTIDAVAKKYGYDGLAPGSAVNLGLLALFGQGLLWRSLAFIALLMKGKKK